MCASCQAVLGWMYVKASNGEQRYKEGQSDFVFGSKRTVAARVSFG
jgi:hypothetical protein